MNAHSVAVLSGREAGQVTWVVQQGSPAELAKTEGLFAELLEDSQAISRWRLPTQNNMSQRIPRGFYFLAVKKESLLN